jgi:hypothetical protein
MFLAPKSGVKALSGAEQGRSYPDFSGKEGEFMRTKIPVHRPIFIVVD